MASDRKSATVAVDTDVHGNLREIRHGSSGKRAKSGATKLYEKLDGIRTRAIASLAAEQAVADRRVVDMPRAERAIAELLAAVGEDLERPGLSDTPARVARLWREFIEHDAGKIDSVFDVATVGAVVRVSGMRVWSMCEHHLLPFWCDVTVEYRPTKGVLGLSKFARIAHKHAHRLQVQERIVIDVAKEVAAVTGCEDVLVTATGEHLCMTMRGVKTPSRMTTTYGLGRYDAGHKCGSTCCHGREETQE